MASMRAFHSRASSSCSRGRGAREQAGRERTRRGARACSARAKATSGSSSSSASPRAGCAAPPAPGDSNDDGSALKGVASERLPALSFDSGERRTRARAAPPLRRRASGRRPAPRRVAAWRDTASGGPEAPTARLCRSQAGSKRARRTLSCSATSRAKAASSSPCARAAQRQRAPQRPRSEALHAPPQHRWRCQPPPQAQRRTRGRRPPSTATRCSRRPRKQALQQPPWRRGHARRAPGGRAN